MSGPNEITCRPARPLPEAPEDAIGQAAGTTSQVRTRERVPEGESVGGSTALDLGGALVHGAETFGVFESGSAASAAGAQAYATVAQVGVDAVSLDVAATAAGAPTGGALLGAALPVALPVAAVAAGVWMIVEADHEIERRGEVYAEAKKLGALLSLEGRGNGPEVQRLRAELAGRDDHDSLMRLRGLLDGIAAADRFVDTHPCEGRQLEARVRLSMNEGQLAVARGTDHGASFERRMEQDPAFRDGVDYMHRLRDERPAEFATRAADVRAMMSHVDASRRAAARM